MSGALATDKMRILRGQIGAAAYDKALTLLAPSQRAALMALSHVGWIDVCIIRDMFIAAAGVVGRAPKTSTAMTYGGVWRLLMRVTTDNALLTRTLIVYAKSYDTGTLTVAIPKPGCAEMVLDGLENGCAARPSPSRPRRSWRGPSRWP